MKPDESRLVYQGDLLSVSVERWGAYEREIVEHPGAVAIVAVDAQGFVALVGQRREATRAGTCASARARPHPGSDGRVQPLR